MKKLQYLLLLMVSTSFTFSCSNNTGKANATRAKGSGDSLVGCYLGVIKKDTILLAITAVEGQTINGTLLFDFYEKDRSKGIINGRYVNGTLLADYTFQSEGLTSTRQVIFRKTSSGFVEGYGNTKMVGEKEVFADTSAIKYDRSFALTKNASCSP